MAQQYFIPGYVCPDCKRRNTYWSDMHKATICQGCHQTKGVLHCHKCDLDYCWQCCTDAARQMEAVKGSERGRQSNRGRNLRHEQRRRAEQQQKMDRLQTLEANKRVMEERIQSLEAENAMAQENFRTLKAQLSSDGVSGNAGAKVDSKENRNVCYDEFVCWLRDVAQLPKWNSYLQLFEENDLADIRFLCDIDESILIDTIGMKLKPHRSLFLKYKDSFAKRVEIFHSWLENNGLAKYSDVFENSAILTHNLMARHIRQQSDLERILNIANAAEVNQIMEVICGHNNDDSPNAMEEGSTEGCINETNIEDFH